MVRSVGGRSAPTPDSARALLENLILSLPRHRHRALMEERDRLDLALKALYPIPADLALAGVPDSQGLGGSTGARGRG